MSYRVGLVTFDPSDSSAHHDPEILQLVDVLRQDGMNADAPAWSIPRDWSSYDLLVLKSPWDYSMRSEEFTGWLSATEKVVPIRNHPWLIRWNYDKRYLLELASAGITTPDFTTVHTVAEAHEALQRSEAARVVVKPTVSAGSRNTGLFRPRDPGAINLVASILRQGKVPMLMRALPAVADVGERSIVLFDGRVSHAVHKAPILRDGGGYLGGHYLERIAPAEPFRDEIELAERCVNLVRSLACDAGVAPAAATPLYSRIDIARDGNEPSVLELELFEPNYFSWTSLKAGLHFAGAVRNALKRLQGR